MKYIMVNFFDSKKDYIYKTRVACKLGDFVVVKPPSGLTIAKVVAANIPQPQFDCKKIIRKVIL